MSAPSIVTHLRSRDCLHHQCHHESTYTETYVLDSGELHTRTVRERIYSTAVVHKYDTLPHDEEADDTALQSTSQQMTLWRSLTPPPPTTLLNRQPSYTFAPLSSLSSHLSGSNSHLAILCSTYPSSTVVVESYSEQPLHSNMCGGWRAEGGYVSRLARKARTEQLLDVVPLPRVLWQLILEYSDDIYEAADSHLCTREVELCRWKGKHDIVPSAAMSVWMATVCAERAKSLVEHSRYQQFDTSGAGWSHHYFLRHSTTPAAASSSSVLHSCTPNSILLTRTSVEAYRKYHQPNVLEHYSYSRPPFQLPPVQGYVQRLAVEVDLPIAASKGGEERGVDESELRVSTTSGMSPTLSIASTNAQTPDSVSPMSSLSLSPSPSLTASPTHSARDSFSATSTVPSLVDSSMAASYHDTDLLHPAFSPRRASLPTYSTSAASQSSLPSTFSPSSSSSLPTDLLFSSTWTVGNTYHRHGVKSLMSDFLQCDVPKGVCPWRTVSRVEFAFAFMPSDAQPLACVILHK